MFSGLSSLNGKLIWGILGKQNSFQRNLWNSVYEHTQWIINFDWINNQGEIKDSNLFDFIDIKSLCIDVLYYKNSILIKFYFRVFISFQIMKNFIFFAPIHAEWENFTLENIDSSPIFNINVQFYSNRF